MKKFWEFDEKLFAGSPMKIEGFLEKLEILWKRL